MSQENVEIVRRLYEAVARRDTETVFGLYDPEVEWDFQRSPVGDLTGSDFYHGYEGLQRWWREWGEAWETYEDACEELIDAGDQVISVVNSSGRGRASGVDVEWTQYGVWRIREGKIVRVAWFATREGALEAAKSRGDVEIVQQLFDAVARRDAATVLSLYDPEVVWDHTAGPANALMGGPTVYHGHEGLRLWFREWYEAWENIEPNIEELIDASEAVISVLTYRGRGRTSGIEVEIPHMAAVWTIREGKIVRAVWFTTREEALEAAGVRE